jgi:hypothetical protein
LRYYKDGTKAKKALGEYDLSAPNSIAFVPKEAREMEIKCGDTTLRLQADTAEDAEMWMTHIQSVIEKYRPEEDEEDDEEVEDATEISKEKAAALRVDVGKAEALPPPPPAEAISSPTNAEYAHLKKKVQEAVKAEVDQQVQHVVDTQVKEELSPKKAGRPADGAPSLGKEEVLKRVAARKAAKAKAVGGAVGATKKMEVLAKARQAAEEKARVRKQAEGKAKEKEAADILKKQVADKVGERASSNAQEAEEKEKKRADLLSRIAARKSKGGATPASVASAIPKTPLTPGVPAFDPAPLPSPAVPSPAPLSMADANAMERERARLADEKDHKSGERHSRGARTRGGLGECRLCRLAQECV